MRTVSVYRKQKPLNLGKIVRNAEFAEDDESTGTTYSQRYLLKKVQSVSSECISTDATLTF